MRDQAEALRRMAGARGQGLGVGSWGSGARDQGSASGGRALTPNTRIIAVSSGKGGVGKTNLVVNLAVAWARWGRRVLLLDGDLGLANVDVLLGINPRWTLEHAIRGERALAEVIAEGPFGLGVISGASGLAELADLSEARRARLVAALVELSRSADVLMIDTSAGIGANVSRLALAATELVVVTTPEPTAITDAYALIKVVTQAGGSADVKLVVNQAKHGGEADEASRKIIAVAQRFLGRSVQSFGCLPSDPAVAQAVRRQVPVVLAYPKSPVSVRLLSLAQRLWEGRPAVAERSSIGGFFRRMALVASAAK